MTAKGDNSLLLSYERMYKSSMKNIKRIIVFSILLFLVACQSDTSDSYSYYNTIPDITVPTSEHFYTNPIPDATISTSEYYYTTHKSIALMCEHYITTFTDVIFMDSYGIVFMIYPQRTPSSHPLGIMRTHVDIIATLYSLDNTHIRWDNVAINSRGDFFMPLISTLDTQQRQEIRQFSSSLHTRRQDNSQGIVIREMEPNSYVNLFATNHYLIIFEARIVDVYFVYEVIKLNLYDGSESTILKKMFSMNENVGQGISDIFVCNNLIYVYRFKTDASGDEHSFIDVVEFCGHILQTYLLEINYFLYMTEVSDEDTIIGIYKQGDYFIITSIHNRIAIFRAQDEGLVVVDVPDSFTRIGGATLIGGFSPSNNLTYFWDFNSTLYIFDLLSEQFFPTTLTIQQPPNDSLRVFQSDRITNIHRNSDGDILVQLRVNWDAYMSWIEQRIEEGVMFGANGLSQRSNFNYFMSDYELTNRIFTHS